MDTDINKINALADGVLLKTGELRKKRTKYLNVNDKLVNTLLNVIKKSFEVQTTFTNFESNFIKFINAVEGENENQQNELATFLPLIKKQIEEITSFANTDDYKKIFQNANLNFGSLDGGNSKILNKVLSKYQT